MKQTILSFLCSLALMASCFAQTTISGLGTMADPLAGADILPFTDVSDTSESANGTTKKATMTQVQTFVMTSAKLVSLTTNGFVKTSGGDGTLSVDTTTYAPLTSPVFVTSLAIPNGAAPTVDATGEFALDTTITDFKAAPVFYDGTDERVVVSMKKTALSATDNYVIDYDAATDEFVMSAASGGGASSVWIGAGEWIPRTTNGVGVDSGETTTNDNNFDYITFDAGATNEGAQATITLPDNYAGGTITAIFFWTAASGSGTVIWKCAARSLEDDLALDTAAGTAQSVTDTLLTAEDMHISSATSAITVAGTPAAHTPIIFTITRDSGTDTLAVDARLLGVEINY